MRERIAFGYHMIHSVINICNVFVVSLWTCTLHPQDLFSIKKAKADSITQKIMMELMMKMMSEVKQSAGRQHGFVWFTVQQ